MPRWWRPVPRRSTGARWCGSCSAAGCGSRSASTNASCRRCPSAPWLPPGSRADVIASRQDEPPANTVVVRLALLRGPDLLVVERSDGGWDLPDARRWATRRRPRRCAGLRGRPDRARRRACRRRCSATSATPCRSPDAGLPVAGAEGVLRRLHGLASSGRGRGPRHLAGRSTVPNPELSQRHWWPLMEHAGAPAMSSDGAGAAAGRAVRRRLGRRTSTSCARTSRRPSRRCSRPWWCSRTPTAGMPWRYSPRRGEWGLPGRWPRAGRDASSSACCARSSKRPGSCCRGRPVAVGARALHARSRPGGGPPRVAAMQLYRARIASAAPDLAATEDDAVDPQWMSLEEFRRRSRRAVLVAPHRGRARRQGLQLRRQVEPGGVLPVLPGEGRGVDRLPVDERPQDRGAGGREDVVGHGGILLAHLDGVLVVATGRRAEDPQVGVVEGGAAGRRGPARGSGWRGRGRGRSPRPSSAKPRAVRSRTASSALWISLSPAARRRVVDGVVEPAGHPPHRGLPGRDHPGALEVLERPEQLHEVAGRVVAAGGPRRAGAPGRRRWPARRRSARRGRARRRRASTR